jgi:hypothetical protein
MGRPTLVTAEGYNLWERAASHSAPFQLSRGGAAMEHFFSCPCCGEEISMVLDLSVHQHTFIEDCEVCCNPLEICYVVEGEQIGSFEVRTLDE